MAESKEQTISHGGSNINSATLMWDASVSRSSVDYSHNMTTASVLTNSDHTIARGPFWDTGRHIINIKVKRCGEPKSGGFGIGIIDKTFDIYGNKWVGSSAKSYSYYVDGKVYNNSVAIAANLPKYKTGDIITVDINLYKRTVSWAINGKYLAINEDIITNIPKEVALGVNLYYKDYSVQIIQYYQM
eukprot:38129_1